MTWAHPTYLVLLLLAVGLAALGVWAWRRRRAALEAFAAVEALRALIPPRVMRMRGWQVALSSLALTLMVLAAAGPRLGFDWQQQKAKGVAISVVLDVSRSMDAMDDGSTPRLTMAKRKVADFVGLLRGDVVGLVLFAAGGYPRLPLTADYGTILWALDDTSTETIRAQGTSMAGALDIAAGQLTHAGASGKAILLVSDGEGHDEDPDLNAALARVKEANIRIFALGIGESKGAPIPLPEGGFKKDRNGDVVLSKLDEALLTRLASETGGAYVHAGPSVADVRGLYESEIREKLEASERGVRRDKVWHEQYQWPLAGALAMMVLSTLLGIGRFSMAPLLLAAVLLPGVAHAGAREDGLAAAKKSDWSTAIEQLGRARVEDPGDEQVGHALGEALYRAGRYREAEGVFRSLAQSDPDHRATHLYNAGNSAYKDGRLDDAAQYLKQAIAADPKMAQAQQNATAVDKEIAARRQQKPPEQKPEDGQDQQDQQQQDQQDQQAQNQPQPQDGQQQQPKDGQDQQQPGQEQQQDAQAQQDPKQQDGQEQGGEKKDGEQQDGQAEGEPDMKQDEESPDSVGVDGEPKGPGEMTKEEAARMVDSVPDGTPRVAMGGHEAEKDW